jgi:ABC-type glycerol-3-phosphate transport system substrate-binding protein
VNVRGRGDSTNQQVLHSWCGWNSRVSLLAFGLYNSWTMNSRICTWTAIVALLLTACGSSASPSNTPVSTSVVTETPAAAAPTPTEPPLQQTLTVWIGSPIAPDAPSPAQAILADRLAEFEATHPRVKIAVRTKDVSGPSGLLDTLAAASVAAPSALPDVISLDPAGLRAAAIKSLIVPLDDLATKPEAPEWYEHALGTAQVNGQLFGLPFAAEAEILGYDLTRYPRPPLSWAELLAGPAPFVFPAGDPSALFTLAEYVSLGAPLSDENGRPSLDPQALAEVLSFYSSSRAAGVIPLSVRQYSADSDTWAALQGGRAAAAAAPLSQFLGQFDSDVQAALPLPTKGGAGVCFAQTWSWAIVTQDPDLQAVSAELIAWLEEPGFLGEWTSALGMLPPNRSALENWPGGLQRTIATRLVGVSRPLPAEEVLVTFGPPLQAAVESVLSGGSTPEQAAQAAAQAVSTP